MRETNIETIAAKLRNQKKEGKGSILFLGAGASNSAGIPMASKLIAELKKDPEFKDFVRGCGDNYFECMLRIDQADRKKIFKKYIINAKINPAHFFAAQLIAEGYIDVVLTTNFDPLVIRSLGLHNYYPAIYDLAITTEIVAGGIDFPAVFYLHGQSHGFMQLNDQYQLSLPEPVIKSVITKVTETRPMIIVGYSGNDPVINCLESIDRYMNSLYWIAHKDNMPEEKVCEKLFKNPNKGCLLLKGYDADTFMHELRNAVTTDGHEAEIIQKPFSFLHKMIEPIMKVNMGGTEVDLTATTQKWLEESIKAFEKGKGFAKEEVDKAHIARQNMRKSLNRILSTNKFEDVLILQKKAESLKEKNINLMLSQIYNNWGTQIQLKTKDQALLKQAIEKYQESIRLYHSNEYAWNNWGGVLYNLAAANVDGIPYLEEAIKKGGESIRIKPDFYDAFVNVGLALAKLAKAKGNEVPLLEESCKKYQEAMKVSSDNSTALHNWGVTLCELWKATGRQQYLVQAVVRFKKSIKVKPDYYLPFDGCAWALNELGTKSQDEKYFLEAIAISKQAIKLKPAEITGYERYGLSLYGLWKMKLNDQLLFDAIEIFKKAEVIKEGKNSFNLACAYSLLNDKDNAFIWLEKALQQPELDSLKNDYFSDPDFNNIKSDARFRELLNIYPKGTDITITK